MQLIFIGESVKVIEKKTEGAYLIKYPMIPWIEIMGLRNLIAHQYIIELMKRKYLMSSMMIWMNCKIP